jgi:hypothetical protein
MEGKLPLHGDILTRNQEEGGFGSPLLLNVNKRRMTKVEGID